MLSKKIKVADVERFLDENPDFFIKNPKILEKLQFDSLKEKDNDKNIISFKDWLIENLKGQKDDLIKNAKHNYLTLKKVHEVILEIICIKESSLFFSYLNTKMPTFFKLELINLVCIKKKLSEEFNLIFIDADEANKIYHSKNHLVMDAVSEDSVILKELKKKVYSNAIFSLDKKITKFFPFLIFGSKDRHFIDNRAYDLILFLSKIIEIKLGEFFGE